MQPLRRSQPQLKHLPLRRRRPETAAAHGARAPRSTQRLGRWIVTGMVLTLAALSLAQFPGRTAALARLDALAADAGLAVTQVGVTGMNRAMPEDVFAAIQATPERSIIAFDVAAARARLEALPWIKSAAISRTLPGELTVRLTERQPFAVWQNRQMLFLIDEDGITLGPVAPSDHPALPVVAGAGAAEEARSILVVVARYPELRKRIGALVRVAGRRWTLKLRNGPDILLAAGDPEASLARLEALQKEQSVLDRQLESVDLRHPTMLVLRPSGATG